MDRKGHAFSETLDEIRTEENTGDVYNEGSVCLRYCELVNCLIKFVSLVLYYSVVLGYRVFVQLLWNVYF